MAAPAMVDVQANAIRLRCFSHLRERLTRLLKEALRLTGGDGRMLRNELPALRCRLILDHDRR